MIKINNGLPSGTTKLIIHELKKAAGSKINALTESIDDAIDAVNNTPNSTIKVTYDKDSEKLIVSDMGFGTGIEDFVCRQIISNFYSHHFTVINGIGRFGLGRFYPFATLGSNPNMYIKTSTGDGVMREVSCFIPDIEQDVWERNFKEYPCEKSEHGTELIYTNVKLSDEELNEMKRFYSIHYALTNCQIKFNGEILEKFNPCYIEILPNGIDTPDGIYVINGFVFKVETHEFKYENSVVKFKLVALHITQKAFDDSNLINKNDSTSALNGGFYGCIGSNILNKGNNAKEFFDLVFTRGGSGATRLFMKVVQDDDNVLQLNDVKALGYEPFYQRHFELNKFRNNKGEKLFDHVAEVLKDCRKLYDRVGQEKHKGYTDEEIKRIAIETYNLSKKSANQTKTCKAVKNASKDVQVQYIQEMFDYVTPVSDIDKCVINVTIPKNKVRQLNLDINTQALPWDWATLTKEDIIIAVSKYLIEDRKDSILFNDFNKKFINYVKHYDK